MTIVLVFELIRGLDDKSGRWFLLAALLASSNNGSRAPSLELALKSKVGLRPPLMHSPYLLFYLIGHMGPLSPPGDRRP